MCVDFFKLDETIKEFEEKILKLPQKLADNNLTTKFLEWKTRPHITLAVFNDIDESRVLSVFDADIVYTIQAHRFGVDCIKSSKDLYEFWRCYQETIDSIKQDYPLFDGDIAVFPAIPASAAFEIGRRYMKGIYPKLKFYDDDNGFFETIVIGG